MKSPAKVMFLLMVAAFMMFSCGKTDTAPSQQAQLMGGWPGVSYERTGCTDAGKNEALSFCTPSCETLMFTATSLTIVKPYTTDRVVDIVIVGNKITMSGTTDVITYLVSGTTLTITSQSPSTGAEANCIGVSIYKRNPQ